MEVETNKKKNLKDLLMKNTKPGTPGIKEEYPKDVITGNQIDIWWSVSTIKWIQKLRLKKCGMYSRTLSKNKGLKWIRYSYLHQ